VTASKGIITRREWLALAATATVYGQSSLDTQGAARDQLYQALELLSGNAPATAVRTAIRLLKGALDQYPSLGDAYYYRHLCLKRLNENQPLQQRDLKAAAIYDSEALREHLDPFKLAVPKIYEDLGTVEQKWALVVGASKFNREKGAPPLQFADADASAFADLLRDPNVGRFLPAQVFLLTNDQATTPAIKARLNTIARRAGSRDIVVVYMSTHGSARSDDLRGVSYLYTYDTDITSRDAIFGSALPMVDVSSILVNRCLAQRTVSIFDTCHSGAADPGQALAVEDMNRLREGAGRYVLSSCQADQLAYEADGHGYFTDTLIRKLRERKGCVRLRDLFGSVRQEVADTVQKKHGKQQVPVMLKSDSATEIVLGIPPGQSSEACSS
jgi:hypothetical protein